MSCLRHLPYTLPFVLLLILESAIATTPPVALHGCQDRCGDLKIPYPFGIGKGCYKNKSYKIVCNGSAAFLTSIGQEVLYWSLTDSLIGTRTHVFSTGCARERDTQPWNLTGTPFFFSSNNRFTAVGCDNKAIMTGVKPSLTGCESSCDNKTIGEDSYTTDCNGYQCCQTTIPPHLQVFDVSIKSLDDNTTTGDRCNAAFITTRTLLPSMLTYPEFPEIKDYRAELVWTFGENCSVGYEDSIITVRDSDPKRRIYSMYKCSCRSGYRGNPYIPGGCQDIDECQEQNPCGRGTCKNLRGSFECNATKTLAIILGFSLGCGLLLLVVGISWLYRFLKKRKRTNLRKKFFERNGGLLLQQQLTAAEGNVDKTKIFNLKELERATDKFSENRILGRGGQGTVFKGMLADGRIVAVKRSEVDQESLTDFINEVVILSQINHRYVVKLLGCCLETEVPMLVYEFIPNGNLSQHLHNQSEDFQMTWEVRLRIAKEVAGALSYLHSAASIPIYHRDIKTTNILLDEKYRAKVADFGTSRSITIDKTHLTTLVQGTIGYLDPEYFQTSRFTEKSDVYSFGVVLVELLTGEKPVSVLRPQERTNLAAHFVLHMKENKLFAIIDARISEQCDPAEVMAVANLARRCLSSKGKNRPTMREVSAELERIRSYSKDPNVQIQGDEEIKAVKISIPESWNPVFTAPALDAATSSPLDADPLVPHRTW